jgi:hypothetical protein
MPDNDTLDEAFRNVAADSMAQGYVVQFLLAQFLKQFDYAAHRRECVEFLRAGGRKTDHLSALKLSDAVAEMLADVAVRQQAALDGLAERALAMANHSRPPKDEGQIA